MGENLLCEITHGLHYAAKQSVVEVGGQVRGVGESPSEHHYTVGAGKLKTQCRRGSDKVENQVK